MRRDKKDGPAAPYSHPHILELMSLLTRSRLRCAVGGFGAEVIAGRHRGATGDEADVWVAAGHGKAPTLSNQNKTSVDKIAETFIFFGGIEPLVGIMSVLRSGGLLFLRLGARDITPQITLLATRRLALSEDSMTDSPNPAKRQRYTENIKLIEERDTSKHLLRG